MGYSSGKFASIIDRCSTDLRQHIIGLILPALLSYDEIEKIVNEERPDVCTGDDVVLLIEPITKSGLSEAFLIASLLTLIESDLANPDHINSGRTMESIKTEIQHLQNARNSAPSEECGEIDERLAQLENVHLPRYTRMVHQRLVYQEEWLSLVGTASSDGGLINRWYDLVGNEKRAALQSVRRLKGSPPLDTTPV